MLVGDKIMLARVLMKKGARCVDTTNEQVTSSSKAPEVCHDGKEIVVRRRGVCIRAHAA